MSNEYWPSDTEYTPGLTKEDWIKILQDPSICYDDCLHVLACFYDYGGEGTCTEIELHYKDTRYSYNPKLNSFGKRIIDSKLCNDPKSLGDDKSRRWPVLFVGKKTDKGTPGSYIWKLRPELKEALESINIQQYLNVKTFDNKLLDYYIREYKKDFRKYFWEENNSTKLREGYKWKAVKCFKDNWDIESNDFSLMLEQSFAASGNLLGSAGSYPLGMLQKYAKVDSESLRYAFKRLFDESQPVANRMQRFQNDTNDINKKYDNGTWNSTYQNPNTISVYLWLRFPEKYFIFKLGLLNSAVSMLDAFYEPEEKSFETVEGAFQFYEALRDELIKDEELIGIENECLNQDCYPDKSGNVLTVDFIHYLSAYCNKNWIIPCNPKDYDLDNYFKKEKVICLKYVKNIRKGDIVFIYVSGAKKRISYKAEVSNINEKTKEMELKLLGISNAEELSYSILQSKGLVSKISSPNILNNELFEYIDSYFEGVENMPNTDQNTNKYVSLLQENHNIILHGAPGTGKTHLAKEIAKAMGCTDNEIGFCQFHPSYDYTDFVEGLRPVKTEAGQVGFERMDGVFKKFCKKAVIADTTKQDDILFSELDSNASVWKVSLEATGDNPTRSDCLSNGYIRIGWSEYKDVVDFSELDKFEYGGKKELNAFQNKMQIGDIVVSCYSQNETDAIGIVTGEYEYKSDGGDYPRYRTVKWLVKDIRENIVERNNGKKMTLSSVYKLNLSVADIIEIVKKYKIPDENPIKKDKNYVFVIDEINRGELSKIFGELFFSIDPGYRGLDEKGVPKGLVKTQYQNLLEDSNDLFKDGFYVPDNVYIIGTMNDIDRSVESMDFAMRRRFTFVEVTAEDSAKNMEITGDAYNKMTAINKVIAEMPELGKSYCIGGAYFKNATDLKELWDLKIKSLVYEYLRGIDNYTKDHEYGEKFDEIKKAYDDPASVL